MNKKIAITLIILVLLGATAYFLSNLFRVEVDSDSVVAASEVKGIVERVSKIAVLPEGEEPVVATVNDLRPLADKPFFKNAQIGYKLLIYEQAGRGILYDPARNKVVEMATITLGNLPE